MKYAMPLLIAVLIAGTGCRFPGQNNLPPASTLQSPGPGVGGPGPGVMMYQPTVPRPGQSSQLAFVGPQGMTVAWDVANPGQFDSDPLICPGRSNFPQGAIYRLKLTNIPGRPGVELYPTLEIGPSMPRTDAYLAHNAIPIQFTEEDFDQVLSGNFVTKVIYLPDPEFQEMAQAGVETLVSTRLDPGQDPIIEADRRGAIMAIVRVGNKDFQIPDGMGNGMQSVVPAGYGMAGPGGPMGIAPGGGGPVPPGYVSGVTAPQYGMPISGTPIGLPGPPHVPLGIPAGLQKHVVRNHTRMNMPEPTPRVRIDVRQRPGYSYPQPAHHARIVERAGSGPGVFNQPLGDRREVIQ